MTVRVLYFHQYFSTPAGSVGIRSYEMARCLIGRGHEVTIVCGGYRGAVTGVTTPFARGMRRGIVDGIDVIEFDYPYANSLSFVQRTLGFMKYAWRGIGVALYESYDVLLATSTPLTVGIPAMAGRWLRGKHMVFEVRDLWPELPKAMGVIKNPLVLSMIGALEWMSYHSAHRLIGLAPGMVDGIARRRIARARITMIPNGCDRELFATDESAWRPDAIPPGALLAVFAGTHGPANGLSAVLDAAAVLKQRGREDIYILLIGDGKLKPELQARAENEGLTNVVFHAPVSKSRLGQLMKATDVGLQILRNVPAFYYGTSPNKFFDYITAGVPVLCNYPGWVSDMLSDYQCGFSVAPDDPEMFADTLEKAANDRAVLKRMRTSIPQLASKFDRTVLANQFVDWLEASRHADGTPNGAGAASPANPGEPAAPRAQVDTRGFGLCQL